MMTQILLVTQGGTQILQLYLLLVLEVLGIGISVVEAVGQKGWRRFGKVTSAVCFSMILGLYIAINAGGELNDSKELRFGISLCVLYSALIGVVFVGILADLVVVFWAFVKKVRERCSQKESMEVLKRPKLKTLNTKITSKVPAITGQSPVSTHRSESGFESLRNKVRPINQKSDGNKALNFGKKKPKWKMKLARNPSITTADSALRPLKIYSSSQKMGEEGSETSKLGSNRLVYDRAQKQPINIEEIEAFCTRHQPCSPKHSQITSGRFASIKLFAGHKSK